MLFLFPVEKAVVSRLSKHGMMLALNIKEAESKHSKGRKGGGPTTIDTKVKDINRSNGDRNRHLFKLGNRGV